MKWTGLFILILCIRLGHAQPCEHLTLWASVTKLDRHNLKEVSLGLDFRHDWAKKQYCLITGFQITAGSIATNATGISNSKELVSVDNEEFYAGIGRRFHLLAPHDQLVTGLTLNGRYSNDKYIYPPPYVSDLIQTETFLSAGMGVYLSYFIPVIKYVGIEGAFKTRLYTSGISPVVSYSLGISAYIPHKKKGDKGSSLKP